MSRQVITRAIALKASLNGQPLEPTPYESRVLKLIPAEVVSVYLGVFQLMQQGKAPHWVFLLVFALLLFADVLYKKQAGVVKWQDFLISGIAFILWVFSFGGPVPEFSKTFQMLSAYLIPVYTLFIPLVYK
ncbi:hypothetical protein SAMN04488505_105273 [Chitinophaga rupis]|uniref:Uncharacterized protein n=1 Tax=Chitinophaga rupis TaxID=573321 RepID=A0A1H8A2Z9_9BACT|nr:hypothetical protein [Chitinophaga rupis]SEM64218.1 hypothetical protein SAMN04488505_105273 [Chitinophaga rupis]